MDGLLRGTYSSYTLYEHGRFTATVSVIWQRPLQRTFTGGSQHNNRGARAMTRIPASKAREQFADVLNDVAFRGERVVLHRHGKDVAAIVSVEDLALLEELEDRYDVEAARAALSEPGANIPWDQLKDEAAGE